VKGGGVSSSSFLGGFKGWGLGFEVWTPLKGVVLIWLASRWGEIAAWILRGGYADARVYVKKVKLVWHWVVLNCLFQFLFKFNFFFNKLRASLRRSAQFVSKMMDNLIF
jgi:hypothetical protein